MEAKIQHIWKVISQESLLLNQWSDFSIPADIQLNKNTWLQRHVSDILPFIMKSLRKE